MSSLELGHYIGDFQRNYAGFIIFSREKKAIFPFKKVIFRESWVSTFTWDLISNREEYRDEY